MKESSDVLCLVPYYLVLVIFGLFFCEPRRSLLDSTKLRKSTHQVKFNPIRSPHDTSNLEDSEIAVAWILNNHQTKHGFWFNVTEEEARKMRAYDCLEMVLQADCHQKVFSFQKKFDWICREEDLPMNEGFDIMKLLDSDVLHCKEECDARYTCNAFTHVTRDKACFLKTGFDHESAVWGKKRNRKKYTFCYKKFNLNTCFCVEKSSCQKMLTSHKCVKSSDATFVYQTFAVHFPKRIDSIDINASNRDKWHNYLRETYEEEKYIGSWYSRSLERDDFNGKHHYLKAGNIRMCSIGKIATRVWRPLFNRYHKLKAENQTHGKDFRFVIYRDPMERMLSAFLHLCYDRGVFINHCHPNKYFADPDSKFRAFTKRVFLQEMVDVLGLHWNVHFMPLHVFCKTWMRSYDFIGMMNSTFSQQLIALRDTIPNPVFKQLITEEFHLDDVNPGNAPKTNLQKIRKYFTTRIIKRLLRYYVRDYIELEIPLPNWIDSFEFG